MRKKLSFSDYVTYRKRQQISIPNKTVHGMNENKNIQIAH